MSVAVADGDTEVVLKQRPSYSRLEGAAKSAPLVGTDKVRSVRVPARLVRRAELTIERSGLADYLEAHLPAKEHRATGGATRVLTAHTVLVGLVTLALTE